MNLGLCLLFVNLLYAQVVTDPSRFEKQVLDLATWVQIWKPLMPDLEVQFVFQTKAEYLAESDFEKNKITLWVRPESTVKDSAEDLLHETAHFFDIHFMTKEKRAAWQKSRGIEQHPWYNACGFTCSDYNSGAGDFAESFSWIRLGGRFKSKLGPTPNDEQRQLLESWIKDAQNGQ